MIQYKYAIIGGGIGGVSAAEAIREIEREKSIAVFTKDAHVLYSRPLLPYYVRGYITRDQLYLRMLADFEKKRINLFLGKGVSAIDPDKKKIFLENGDAFFYDKLLITSGGDVEMPGVPSDYIKDVLTLRSVEDADILMKRLVAIKEAVVAGSSFSALQLIEIFAEKKIPITVLTRASRFFGASLDDFGADFITSNFRNRNIEVFYNDEISDFSGEGRLSEVITVNSRSVKTDVVAMESDLNRDLDFYSSQGFSVGRGIKTDEYLATSQEDVWAAGDAAEFKDVVFGKERIEENSLNAFMQGRCAALNMTGTRKIFRAVTFCSVVNFGLHITKLGEAEMQEGVEIISRFDTEARKYERFFIKDSILKGAFIINMFNDLPVISDLIKRKVSLKQVKANFSDIKFDFSQLEVV